uniref:sensory rhodopsin transducer n=1 Tax=Rhizobium meliloti TaxID=382 RepID=UPI001F1C2D4B|nr:sensory rhodopsin transducer [Sinorhizobium meliloti]
MQAIGKRRWTIAGGRIPLESNGTEPEFTSRDEIAVLNCCDSPARLRIHIHYADRPAVGPYEGGVAAGRARRTRFNDLIFPGALPLDGFSAQPPTRIFPWSCIFPASTAAQHRAARWRRRPMRSGTFKGADDERGAVVLELGHLWNRRAQIFGRKWRRDRRLHRSQGARVLSALSGHRLCLALALLQVPLCR